MRDGGLRQLFRRKFPEIHFQSIEIGFDRGIPDTNYCCEKIEGWIEFKFTRGIKVNLSWEQVAWIEKRIRSGGRVYIGVRFRSRKEDTLWIIHGEMARRLKEQGFSPNAALAVLEGGPRNWDWKLVRELILT
jgi:hypothetical protein